jgi:hypothetical protein
MPHAIKIKETEKLQLQTMEKWTWTNVCGQTNKNQPCNDGVGADGVGRRGSSPSPVSLCSYARPQLQSIQQDGQTQGRKVVYFNILEILRIKSLEVEIFDHPFYDF